MLKSDFYNEPLTDFSRPENRQAMLDALQLVQSQLGKEYSLLIGGKAVHTDRKVVSINPSKTSEVVGLASKANASQAVSAIEAAAKAFGSWRRVPAEKRAEYLFQAAHLMRARKHEFAAWMVYEVGKNWAEADGDVAEAIDFMEFYGREMLRYAHPQPLVPYPGENNELRYIPLGVGAVIPPWNFPCAILVGMTTAAIVTGNTVVLKPSSDTPVIAAKFIELMQEVGLPDGVLNFIPGSGSEVGDTIVGHRLTRFIAFTGSKDVGLHINELASKTAPGQIWIKRVVAEMGGKDAIVVDETADLESAAAGIVSSAFGFQGQKCSACSRAIVVDSVYDTVLEKVVSRTKALTVGPVVNPANHQGPVASKSAFDGILDYIEIGKKEGRLMTGGEPAEDEGYFIYPTIFADVPAGARISCEEIFGPVLAFSRAKDWREAIDMANATEFGLTGAFYSSVRERLEEARDRFHVGNLYFNRKCTGALVGVHPFGGFNMSGTDSKAGGRDYLLLFLQAKSIAEKI
jgi:1-pyrroline-5-carboxylate dehydrogenase